MRILLILILSIGSAQLDCEFGGFNCVCDKGECHECNPFETVGVYPNCVCREQDRKYVTALSGCYRCPSDSTGEYPKCDCEHPFQYVEKHNRCVSCPESSTGIFPHCECDNGYFSEQFIRCIECPKDATGLYPDCECNDANSTFSAYINRCYLECPDGSSGIQPNCRCNGEYIYDANDAKCKRDETIVSVTSGPGMQYLPPPVKKPTDVEVCPDDSGKWPQCGVSIDFCVLRSCIG